MATGRRRQRSRFGIPSGFRTLRDVFAFLLGAAILTHEVFIARSADPAALTIAAALLGLPIAVAADERKKGGA